MGSVVWVFWGMGLGFRVSVVTRSSLQGVLSVGTFVSTRREGECRHLIGSTRRFLIAY